MEYHFPPMQKLIAFIVLTISFAVATPAEAASYRSSGIYRHNPQHVLSHPYHRVRRQEDYWHSLQPRIYDDGVVRVVDNTRKDTTRVTHGRLTPSNHRRTRYHSRYPHTRYAHEPYRKRTSIHLPSEHYCDWVTYFDKYHDGVGWVDYERIIPECDTADGFIRYFARDPIGRGRYTPSSYNQYDSYYWSDGHQRFNTYGW